MAKKRQQERLFLMYPNEQELLRFYANLPKRAKRRLRLYARWHCLSLIKEDFDLLKGQLLRDEEENDQQRVIIESNIQFKLHESPNVKTQSIPWGVKRLEAPEEWKRSEGQSVKVGVIDTGIFAQHPDLRANIKGGVNTYNTSSPFIDENGHGTHVAGIIAARNNTSGVVGMAPRAELYALKCFSPEGSADLLDIADAIDWAIRQRIRVLNMSFGSQQKSQVLHCAMKAALKAGIIMVASAGNSASLLDYPAKYPEALSIGAFNSKNKIADFSNYGRTLNYVAPGVDILSTWPVAPGYNTLSGTSMSAPHVSGLCALLLAKDPELTPKQIKQILDRSAQKLPHIKTIKQGRGVVTAPKMMSTLETSKKKK